MKDNIKILIVEDSKVNIDLIREILKKYNLMIALSGERALQIAEKKEIDLILLDIVLPGIDGFETCRKLKKIDNVKDIPIIFCTAQNDEDSIEKSYDIGGVDYITKPYKAKEILTRVKTHLKLRSVIKYLDNISSYDQMTGLYNRRKFFELATNLFNNSKNGLYAVIIDIDKLKLINNTYGHPIGDIVIKAIAEMILAGFEETDVLGRIGGEEFACLFYVENNITPLEKIEKIRNSIENQSIAIGNGQELQVTISSGISKVLPRHVTLDEVLKEADDTLYESKHSGRNKSIFRI